MSGETPGSTPDLDAMKKYAYGDWLADEQITYFGDPDITDAEITTTEVQTPAESGTVEA